jgi:hypothetical protein
MAKAHVQAQQDKYFSDVEGKIAGADEIILDIGWTKKKGVAKCLFCREEIKYYSFRCPVGGAVACNPCKNNMCRFTPPKQDEADDYDAVNTNSEEDGVGVESVGSTMRGKEHAAEHHGTKAEEVPNHRNGDRKHGAGTQKHDCRGTNHETHNATVYNIKPEQI